MDSGATKYHSMRASSALFLETLMRQSQQLCRREAAAPYENPLSVGELPSSEVQRLYMRRASCTSQHYAYSPTEGLHCARIAIVSGDTILPVLIFEDVSLGDHEYNRRGPLPEKLSVLHNTPAPLKQEAGCSCCGDALHKCRASEARCADV